MNGGGHFLRVAALSFLAWTLVFRSGDLTVSNTALKKKCCGWLCVVVLRVTRCAKSGQTCRAATRTT